MSNLLLLFLIPFCSTLILLLLPPFSGIHVKRIALILTLLPLAFLIYGQSDWMKSSIDYAWIPQLDIHFHLSVDSISLLFLYLIAIIVPMSILAFDSTKLSNPRVFYGLVLFLQGLLIGFFTARDLVVFTIFWEAILLPLYFIIVLWGGLHRKAAALKFLIYMIAGSFLMVLAIFSLYFTATSFDLARLANISQTIPHADWLFAIFFLAFAVKTPLFPFHAWLPDAYYEAPTSGTILLSAVLSKAGVYGFLRIGLGLFSEVVKAWNPFLLGLAIAGTFYGGFAAWKQRDFKRLIAYSSFSHVNFILAGVFAFNAIAESGAVLQSLNHAVTITGLFLVASWLEERIHSTSIQDGGGLAKFFPQLCWLTLIFVLSSIALPGTNNFVGELMILFGLFGLKPIWASVLALTIILSAIYMLNWMQRMYFETSSLPQTNKNDIHRKEIAISLPLLLLIFWIGIYPLPFLKALEKDQGIIPKELQNLDF